MDIMSIQIKLPEKSMKKSEEIQLQIAQLQEDLEMAKKSERAED